MVQLAPLRQAKIHLFTTLACLVLCPLLGGCVDYDLGIQFDRQTRRSLS
ncbi:MAG: hypothetical protein WA885_17525 [Phormidesmis sp.]